MGTIMTLEGQGVTTSEMEEMGGGLISSEDVFEVGGMGSVADGASIILHMYLGVNAPQRDMYAKIRGKMEGVAELLVYEDPSIAAGLPGGLLTPFNTSTGEAATSNAVLTSSNPVVDANGVLIAMDHVGANQPGVIGPTYLNTGGHEYLIMLTNLSGGAIRGSLMVSWSEVPLS